MSSTNFETINLGANLCVSSERNERVAKNKKPRSY